MTQIVTINVSQNNAPAPSTLQRTGYVVSQGLTTLAANALALITQASDLTPLLAAARAVTSAIWSTGTLTVTVTASLPAHLVTGSKFATTLAGFTSGGPGVINGQYFATVTGASTFTVPLATNPGSVSVEGTYTYTDDLVAQTATFFAQGSQNSFSVLELGDGTPAAGVTALTSYLNLNPGSVYAILVPRNWDGEATFRTGLIPQYESTTSKLYFFVTTTNGTYTNYTALMKDVVALIEAPATPPTEFSIAAAFWTVLNYNPSGTNRVTPFAFAFLFGVTPYPAAGNGALFAAWKTANVNIVQTASEGGLTNTMLAWGTTMDGHDFSYWYSVDWLQINAQLALANAIINGSNNPLNPLYYNQDGINRLQDTVVQTIQTAITDGMAIGGISRTALTPSDFIAQMNAGAFAGNNVVNAIGFTDYTAENPSDYGIGKYAGLSAIYIPSRGFEAIIFNILVTQNLNL